MTRCDEWHDGSIHHTEILNSSLSYLRTHYSILVGIRAHFTGSRLVVHGEGNIANRTFPVNIRSEFVIIARRQRDFEEFHVMSLKACGVS
jgi:hypothetical protein